MYLLLPKKSVIDGLRLLPLGYDTDCRTCYSTDQQIRLVGCEPKSQLVELAPCKAVVSVYWASL